MKFRVLIIDDDENIRHSYAEFLRDCGFSVDCAECGEKAKELLAQNKYGVVLLDLVLEEMNGLDLVDHILKHNSMCKIIVITGFGSVETAVECWHNGCTDFLEKPCKPDDLQGAIERAFVKDEKARFDYY